MNKQLSRVATRPEAIVRDYLSELDKHMDELRSGSALRTLEIRDFAGLLHIHPRHLSNTIHQVLGKSPCDLYEERLLQIARELLAGTSEPIAEIARRLTYDPSNFTKFFKRFSGMTPKEFRHSL